MALSGCACAHITDELRGSIPFQATMKNIVYNKDKAYQVVRILVENKLKNPDTSVLKEQPIKKKVHACTTPEGVKVYAVWYE